MRHFLSYLLPAVWILEVDLTADKHSLRTWCCRHGKVAEGPPYRHDLFVGKLLVITILGHGTITKPISSELVKRIQSDPETFISSLQNDRFSFVRRDRLRPLFADLVANEIYPQRILVSETPTDAARIVQSSIDWKSFIRPTNENSALAQALIRRIRIPILVFFFFILVINMLFAPSLNKQHQELLTTVGIHEQKKARYSSINTRQRELLEPFNVKPAIRRSIICDRIASAVPQKIVLTALQVEPLKKQPKQGTQLERSPNMVFVCGVASDAREISRFVENLSIQKEWRDVRLTAIEQGRNNRELSFRIEIAL